MSAPFVDWTLRFVRPSQADLFATLDEWFKQNDWFDQALIDEFPPGELKRAMTESRV